MHRYSPAASVVVLAVAAILFPFAWAVSSAGFVLFFTGWQDDTHVAMALLCPFVAIFAGTAWSQVGGRRWPRRRCALALAVLFGVGSTAGAWWAASRDWVPPYGKVPPGWGVTDWIAFYDQWWLFAVPLPALVVIVLLVRHYAGSSEVELRALWTRAGVVRVQYLDEDTENFSVVYDLEYYDRADDIQRVHTDKRVKGASPSKGDPVLVWYDPLHPATVLSLQAISGAKSKR